MNLKELSIATFNLYNLNEPGLALYTDKDGWSQAEYDLKIAWTARQLTILMSDVFGFQELWHAASLNRALDAAGLAEMKGNNTPVIVLGDINDSQHSNTANILTEQPRYLVGDSVGGGDVAMYTAQTLQEYRDTRDVYYTHVHQDIRESLDHILVSEQFYDNSRRRLWLSDGMAVNNDHLNVDDHEADGTNDHGIIRAVFKHKPIK